MTEQGISKASLVEQIVEESFARLDHQEEFGPETVEELRRIFAEGDLAKGDPVIRALRCLREESDEAA